MSKKCGCDGNCGSACQCKAHNRDKISEKPKEIER